MRATEDQLLENISAHAGTTEGVRRATIDVLAWISSGLSVESRAFVADELPGELADVVIAGEGRPLILRGHRYELAASVCRVLAEELSDEAIAELRPALPPVLARLFVRPSPEGREPPSLEPESLEPHRPTLASGRPQAAHPLAESRPEPTQHDTVADPNPHAHTKLSSNDGLPQERVHETVADARPEHPIAGR